MKDRSAKSVRLTENLVWIGLGMGALFWILEAAIHVFIFEKVDLIEEVLRPGPHETWMRLIVVAMFVVFAMYAQLIIRQRNRAVEATRLAHAELNQIFQTAADGMRVVDTDFSVLRVNETLAKQSGLSKDEAIGKKCYEVFRGPLCHTPYCPLARIMAGAERVEYHTDKERTDGKKVPCIVTATAFRGHKGELIGIVEDFKDVSKYKMAEKALKESEEKLRQLAENLEEVLWIVSPDWNEVLYISPAYERVWSRACEGLYQHPRSWLDAVAEEDRDRVIADIENKMAGNWMKAEFPEYRILKPDGSERWVLARAFPVRDEHGEVKRVVGISEDITRRKQAEAALKASEERYRRLFEDSRDAIYITVREGQIVDVNQSALDLFGYVKEEMLGLSIQRIYLNPDDRPGFQQRIEQAGAVRDYELKLCKKDGTRMDCLVTASVRRGTDGTILGYQGVIRDITESKRLEEQFYQAQKMEAIGTLAGGIAHDFNNLLMSIQGRASLISVDLGRDHPHHEDLAGIEDAVRKGAQLTKQLLGFARGGKYEVRPTAVNQLVEESSRLFGRTRKEIKVHRRYGKDLWPVEVDRGQIEQVMLNLFVNAWQAMPTGGNLYLETSNVSLDLAYSKPLGLKPGDYVKISVKDTGVGMDEATRQRVFEPFFTTREIGGGTGLGLASAFGIIRNHGGAISVHSQQGHGATFEIYLPASDRPVRMKSERPVELIKGEGAVLLVDDEDMVLDVGRKMLSALGYEVMVARSGKQALEVYEASMDKIDMVVLDMIMPDMGGGQLYGRLRDINASVKVLLSSGYSIDSEANEILNRGCDGFIQKPFNIEALSSKMKEVLGQ